MRRLSAEQLLAGLIVGIGLSPAACVSGQMSAYPSGDPVLIHQGGIVRLSATAAWPEAQIVEELRREYGWTIDYEQAPQLSRMLITDADGRLQPKMRSVVVSLPEPVDRSRAEELRVLKALARGLSKAGERVEAVPNGSGGRFDIVPAGSRARPMLDTKIELPLQPRTFDETVKAILHAISARTGQHIVQGGIATGTDPQVLVGGDQPESARKFLAQTIDEVGPNVWVLTYDPGMHFYAIAIEGGTGRRKRVR